MAQLSIYVQVIHLRNERLPVIDLWGKVDWETVASGDSGPPTPMSSL